MVSSPLASVFLYLILPTLTWIARVLEALDAVRRIFLVQDLGYLPVVSYSVFLLELALRRDTFTCERNGAYDGADATYALRSQKVALAKDER